MKLTKRLVALLVCVMMVVSILPMGVSAAVGNTTNRMDVKKTWHEHLTFEGLENGKVMTANDFNSQLDRLTFYDDHTYVGASNGLVIMADPAAPESGNTVVGPTNATGTVIGHGGLCLQNSKYLSGAFELSYRIYMTHRNAGGNEIPLLRIVVNGGNFNLITLPAVTAAIDGSKTVTSLGNLKVNGSSTNFSFNSLTWYKIRTQYDPVNGDYAVYIDDETDEAGEILLRAGVATKGTVSRFTINRGYNAAHYATAYFDDITVSALDALDKDPIINFDGLTTTNWVKGSDGRMPAVAGYPSGTVSTNSLSSSWVLNSDSGLRKNYLSRNQNNGVTMGVNAVGMNEGNPFVISFDFRPDSLASASSGILNLGSDNSSHRVISYWDDDYINLGANQNLVIWKVTSDENPAAGSSRCGEWLHFDVVTIPTMSDSGTIAYFEYEIYVNGSLQLKATTNDAGVTYTVEHRDCRDTNTDGDLTDWVTTSVKGNFDTQRSPFLPFTSELKSLYFFHYSNYALAVDNIGVRTFTPDTVPAIDAVSDEPLNLDFKTVSGVDCAKCLAEHTLLNVLDYKGSITADGYTLGADGKSGMCVALSDGKFDYFENGTVAIESTLRFSESVVGGWITVASMTSYSTTGVMSQEEPLVQLRPVDGGVVFCGTVLDDAHDLAYDTDHNIKVTVTLTEASPYGVNTYEVKLYINGEEVATDTVAYTAGTMDPDPFVLPFGKGASEFDGAYNFVNFEAGKTFQTLTLLASEGSAFVASNVKVTCDGVPTTDAFAADFEDASAEIPFDLSGNATVADGVLTLADGDTAVWNDSGKRMASWLRNRGFTVEMKVKSGAVSKDLISLVDVDGNKTALLSVDEAGKILIDATANGFNSGALYSISDTSYTDIAIVVTAPNFDAEKEWASVFADGKFLGNVPCDAKVTSVLAAIEFCGDMTLDTLSIHEGVSRAYVAETGILFDLDMDNYVWSGSNRSAGAISGNALTEGVATFGLKYVPAAGGESAYFTTLSDIASDSFLFVTGGLTGQNSVVEGSFKLMPLGEGATTSGYSDLLRLRFQREGMAVKHVHSLKLDNVTGMLYLPGKTPAEVGEDATKISGICDSQGNPYRLSEDAWTDIALVVGAKSAYNEYLRYVINGELAYCGSSYDAETGKYTAVDVYVTGNLFTNASDDPNMVEEVRVRPIYAAASAGERVALKNIKAYRVDSEPVELLGFQKSKAEPAIRFLVGLDMLYYKEVGVEMDRWSDEEGWTSTRVLSSSSVYTSIEAGGETITAVEEGVRYFLKVVIEDINSSGAIRIRPYSEVDGVKSYGEAAVYAITYNEDGTIVVTKGFTQDFADGVTKGKNDNKEGYAASGTTSYADLVDPIGDFRWGGDTTKEVGGMTEENGNSCLVAYPGLAGMNAYVLEEGSDTPTKYSGYKTYSGRMKFSHLIPGDLTPYIGQTMKVVVRVDVANIRSYVGEAGKYYTTQGMTEDKTQYASIKGEFVTAESVDLSFYLFTDYNTTIKSAWNVSDTYKDAKVDDGWVTMSLELEITQEVIDAIYDHGDDDDKWPLRPTLGFGGSFTFAQEIHVDDLSVFFFGTPTSTAE